ncbi:JAB domain-containing protein [Metaclostridioides mangenotii]
MVDKILVSIGSIDSVIFHPRVIFKAGILCDASKIICFHIHP